MTYELLDEIVDHGVPQLTEAKILKKFITTSSSSSLDARTPTSIAASVPWRANGIKHKRNEIFLDVIEKIDCLVGGSNEVLRASITGTLRMKSFLSGIPELNLGLNDRALVENSGTASAVGGVPAGGRNMSVELEDVRFHQCVRLNKFEAERTISFIPPDGEFTLMSYRLPNVMSETQCETQLPFWVECTLGRNSLDPSTSRVDYIIKLKSTFKPRTVASSVKLMVPTPKDATAPTFKVIQPHTCKSHSALLYTYK